MVEMTDQTVPAGVVAELGFHEPGRYGDDAVDVTLSVTPAACINVTVRSSTSSASAYELGRWA